MKKVIWGTVLLLFLAGCGSSVTSDSTQGSSSISTNESTKSQSSESAKDILSKDDLMNKVFVGKATSKDGSESDYSISFNALVPPEVDFKGDVLNTQISGYGNEFFERMNIEPKNDSYLVTAYNLGSTSDSPDVSLDIKKDGPEDISFSNNDLDVEASYDEEYTKSVSTIDSSSINKSDDSLEDAQEVTLSGGDDWKGLKVDIRKGGYGKLSAADKEEMSLEDDWILILEVSLENTTKDIDFYSNILSSTVVIGNQQADAEMFLTDSELSGEIYHGVTKTGSVVFQLKEKPSLDTITNLRLLFSVSDTTDEAWADGDTHYFDIELNIEK